MLFLAFPSAIHVKSKLGTSVLQLLLKYHPQGKNIEDDKMIVNHVSYVPVSTLALSVTPVISSCNAENELDACLASPIAHTANMDITTFDEVYNLLLNAEITIGKQ